MNARKSTKTLQKSVLKLVACAAACSYVTDFKAAPEPRINTTFLYWGIQNAKKLQIKKKSITLSVPTIWFSSSTCKEEEKYLKYIRCHFFMKVQNANNQESHVGCHNLTKYDVTKT